MQILAYPAGKRILESVFSDAELQVPVITYGEKIPLEISRVTPGNNLTTNRLWLGQDVSDWSFKVALGVPNLEALSGGHTVTYNGGTSAEINYNDDAETIEAKLNAIAQLGVDGGIEVTGEDGYFALRFVTGGAKSDFGTGSNNLAPLSTIEFGIEVEGDADTREVQIMHITQNAAAYVLLTTDGPGPSITVDPLQVGGVGQNAQYRVSFDVPAYDGKFLLNVNDFDTGFISYDADEEEVLAALVAITGMAITEDDVIVAKEDEGSYLIYFQGALAETAVTLTANANGLKVLSTKIGTLNTSTPGIERLLAGGESADVVFEVWGKPDASADYEVIGFQETTIRAPLIHPSTTTPVAADEYYTKTEADDLFLGAGSVWLRLQNGDITEFRPADDTDLERGISLLAAITAAAATPDPIAILIGPGRFDTDTTYINLPNKVSLLGSGNRATILTGTIGLSATGCLINPGDDSTLADFRVEQATDGALRGAIGAKNAQKAFLRCTIRNVDIEGGSDGFYISRSGNFSAEIFNMRAHTSYDNFVVANATSARVDVYSSTIDTRGTHPAASGSGEGNTAVLVHGSSTVARFFACDIETVDNAEGPSFAASASTSASASFFGCRLVGNDTNDFKIASSGVINVAGGQYRPTAITGGSLTVLDGDAVKAAIGMVSGILPIASGGNGQSTMPYMFRSKTAAAHQTFTTGVDAGVVFGVADADVGGITWSGNVATLPRAGVISVNFRMTGDAASWYVRVKHNATEKVLVGNTSIFNTRSMCMDLVVAASDTIEIRAQQSAGSNRFIYQDPSTALGIVYIR